jgi:hypothetical protein
MRPYASNCLHASFNSAGLIALLLRPIFEGHDQVELGMPWQMRNVNLTCRTIAIELCEIFIVRHDDHCMRSHAIRVIGAMGCSMQVRDSRSGEHVHDTDLVDVYRLTSEAVFDPLHRSLIQAHWFIMGISWNSRKTCPVALTSSQNPVFSVWILRICRPVCNDCFIGDKRRPCPQSICNSLFICGLMP